MTQKQYSTKKRGFQHLTSEKRAQIEILLRTRMPKAQIARMVGISRSTLYNEIKRRTVVQMDTNLRQYSRYFGESEQRVYEEHRKNSRPPLKLVQAYAFVVHAEKQILEEKLAPETICGAAKRSRTFEVMVCAKTLYNYIDQQLLKVRNLDLLLKTKRKQNVHHGQQHKHLFGISIEERPDAVNNREEFGHWEIDTVVGKRESAPVLLTLDERTTCYRHIIKIPSRSAEAVKRGIQQLREIYGERFNRVFRSVTSDNGSEFSTLPDLLPEMPVYYAHPYSSYERGLNEKQNSLIRCFFPKGRSLDGVSPDAIQREQAWINRFPRKAFGFASADEIFQSVLFDIAI